MVLGLLENNMDLMLHSKMGLFVSSEKAGVRFFKS